MNKLSGWPYIITELRKEAGATWGEISCEMVRASPPALDGESNQSPAMVRNRANGRTVGTVAESIEILSALIRILKRQQLEVPADA